MTPAEMKLQCLTLAQGDTDHAQRLVDWVLDPLPADSASSLTPPATEPQPGIPPAGAPRR